MNNKSESAYQPTENQLLNTTLMQMSKAEIIQMITTIEGLQADLFRLLPLFNGKEPTEAVVHTQDLLKILHDEINQVLTAKQTQDSQNHLRILDAQSIQNEHITVHRLLNRFQKGKHRLVWAGIDGDE